MKLEMMGRLRNEHISHMTSDKQMKYVIRSLRNGETKLLKDFLYEAIFVPLEAMYEELPAPKKKK